MQKLPKTKHHTCQQIAFPDKKDNPVVEVIYPDGTTETYLVGALVVGIRHNGHRPVDIRWFNTENVELTQEIKDWVYNELQHVFPPNIFHRNVVPKLLEKTS